MATEQRLIDEFRRELMSDFIALCRGNDFNKLTLLRIGETIDSVYEKFSSSPTVDAVEVVRCKNCRHYQNGYCNHFGYYDYAPAVDAEDFCSHAWRKDGDGNA